MFPFAGTGCVTTPLHGQRVFDEAARSGWYTSDVQPSPYERGTTSAAATKLLLMAGIPDRSNSKSHTRARGFSRG